VWERECGCVWERDRERESLCVCVCVCVCVLGTTTHTHTYIHIQKPTGSEHSQNITNAKSFPYVPKRELRTDRSIQMKSDIFLQISNQSTAKCVTTGLYLPKETYKRDICIFFHTWAPLNVPQETMKYQKEACKRDVFNQMPNPTTAKCVTQDPYIPKNKNAKKRIDYFSLLSTAECVPRDIHIPKRDLEKRRRKET